MTDDNTYTVLCPTCQQAARYHSNNLNRPFCSARCRLIDLGEWATEGHRIPGKSAPPDFNDPTETH